ncbi:MAG: type I restriction-modification system subunit M N-terminal domain-containing protein [Burkholderiales bacterium]
MNKEQLKQFETDLWRAADNLRANSDLKSNENSIPVLGLIFVKFADNYSRRHEAAIISEYQKLKGTRREKKLSEIAIEKCGFYLFDHARYEYCFAKESIISGRKMVPWRTASPAIPTAT